MTTFNVIEPLEPHQVLARKVARQWRQEHRFRAQVVELLAMIKPARGNAACHPLEQCPETSQEQLEQLAERWARHWCGSLCSTAEGRLELQLRGLISDARLDL